MISAPPAPGRIRYHAVRLFLKALCSAYVRTRVLGAERIPRRGAYIICFNHPSWLDPVFFAAFWPDRERDLYIFGPREADMGSGVRNAIITWTRRGVPFQPHAADVIDTTRRAVSVLATGACLAIAGEGRLSDHEGRILPLETGLAHFARLSKAPILPVAVIGTRWISFGSRVTLRVGDAVDPADYRAGKAGAAEMTEEVERRLQGLLEGVANRQPPGWLGRTISEAFNDRPWLDEPERTGSKAG
ncbi:MAG: lysophospholipid acyltransferase family protein [Candidatus Limnocylindrales bacterium]